MGRRAALDTDQTAELGARYEAGEGLSSLAHAYGISYTAARNAVLRTGTPFREAHVTLSRKGNPGYKKDIVSYQTRHRRIYAARGKAAGPCAHCGTMKAVHRFEWAQLQGTSGMLPEHYASLCRPCHEDYDAASITAEQAGEIRFLRYSGLTNLKLAQMYGVDPSYISKIVTGQRRKAQALACEGAG